MKAQNPARVVACPTCGQAVEWRPESRFRPFCSERCKLIDIGAWASEKYRIEGKDEPLSDEADREGGLL